MTILRKGYRDRAAAVLLVGLMGPALSAAQERQIEKIYEGHGRTAVEAVQIEGNEIRIWTRSGPVTAEAAAAPKPQAEAASQPEARFISSEDGSQIGRVTYLAGEDGAIRSVFEKAQGGTSARIERPTLASFYISNDGQTVVAIDQDIHRPRDSRITIYDVLGRVLGEAEQPLIRSAQIAANGSRVAVNTGGDGVLVFDRQAKRLHALPAAADFRLSADGGTVAVFLPGAVASYREGVEAARIPTSGIARDVDLTANGNLVAVVDRTNLRLHDIAARNTLFTRQVSARSGEYKTVDIAPDGVTVAAGRIAVREKKTRSKEGRAEAEVQVFDRTGQLLFEERFPTRNWNRLSPDIRFFGASRKMLVRSGNSVYLLAPPLASR